MALAEAIRDRDAAEKQANACRSAFGRAHDHVSAASKRLEAANELVAKAREGQVVSVTARISNNHTGSCNPLRHSVEAMQMGSRGRIGESGRARRVDGGEDGDEPLQTAWDRRPCIARSLSRRGRREICARLLSPLCERCLIARNDLAPSGGVGAELFGEHVPERAALLLRRNLPSFTLASGRGGACGSTP